MLWDYCEINPFGKSTGSWEILSKWTRNSVWTCLDMPDAGFVTQGTATRLPFPNDFFDAVITDPPYYDNVPYSDLSDFFYVWLKKTVGDLYPDLFSTPLTPKSQEIVMHPIRHGNDVEKAKRFFEDMITQSFKEIHRVLRNDGIAVIVFAYKARALVHRTERVYPKGHAYDFYKDIREITKNARHEVFIIDAYASEELLDLYLEKIPSEVRIRILTNKPQRNFMAVAQKFKMKPNVHFEVRSTTDCHDRLFFVDENCWVIGQSIKDAGKKPTYLVNIEGYNLFRKVFDDLWKNASALI